MGRRRVHSKSRFGCDPCKRRRVKCNEKVPCTACVFRKEDCHYSKTPQPPFSGSSLAAHSPATMAPAPAPAPPHQIPLDDFSSSTRRRELELMHFWFTRTSQGFTSDLTDLFRNDVVKAALEHEYLSDFMFALTSLHIASETSDHAAAASYVATALRYQSNAFPQFRTALENITESNCNAIFLSSLMSMACSFVSPFLVSKEKEPGRSSTGCVFSLHHFIIGIGSIIGVSREWLQKGPYRLIACTRQGFQAQLSEKVVFACDRLRCLNSLVTTSSKPHLYQMYESAISGLSESFGSSRAVGMTWLHLAGKDFANQLQQEDPLALVILMYWGVLLCKLNEMWWATFSGRKLVEEVYEMLNGQGGEWDEAMKWARLELDL